MREVAKSFVEFVVLTLFVTSILVWSAILGGV